MSVQWSKLNKDDKSWDFIVDLDELLPKVGRKYALPVSDNENAIKDGKAYILWTPPHSELNGWFDKRPSEILQTFVVEGLIATRAHDVEMFDFVVLGLTRLTDVFERMEDETTSPVWTIGVIDESGLITSRMQWQDTNQNRSAYVSQYIYLYGYDGPGETDLELIMSRKGDRLCVHYSAELPVPNYFRVITTKYFLNEAEQQFIESLLEKAEIIVDSSMDELPEGKLFGAEYQ